MLKGVPFSIQYQQDLDAVADLLSSQTLKDKKEAEFDYFVSETRTLSKLT